jgi:hypothetical protein
MNITSSSTKLYNYYDTISNYESTDTRWITNITDLSLPDGIYRVHLAVINEVLDTHSFDSFR